MFKQCSGGFGGVDWSVSLGVVDLGYSLVGRGIPSLPGGWGCSSGLSLFGRWGVCVKLREVLVFVCWTLTEGLSCVYGKL